MMRWLASVSVILLAAAAVLMAAWSEPTDQQAMTGFVRIEVMINPADAAARVGSYQAELTLTHAAGEVLLAGVSGGEGVFKAPPAYDPAALHSGAGPERVIIADFAATDDPSPGPVVVAVLDAMLPAGGTSTDLVINARLKAAGNERAEPIAADLSTRVLIPELAPADR
ncbi:MAG: hypothetical protein AAF747_02100 [Planctomycetota bacterium]